MIKLLDSIKPFDHIIWDWNGTLLNDLSHAVNTVNHLLKKRELPLLDETKYKQEFRFPVRLYYESIGFDLDKESFSDLCNEFVDLYMNGVFECPMVDGAFELLKTINQQGKTQSILSATDQINLEKMMEFYSLNQIVNHVFGIEDKLAASKLYRGKELISQSKHLKQKTVLIGDTDHDLEVGRELGIEVILVSHGHQSEEKLKKIHNNVFTRH